MRDQRAEEAHAARRRIFAHRVHIGAADRDDAIELRGGSSQTGAGNDAPLRPVPMLNEDGRRKPSRKCVAGCPHIGAGDRTHCVQTGAIAEGGLGVATTCQVLPSQCSARVLVSLKPPTAQTSVAEMATLACSLVWPGCGLVTIRKGDVAASAGPGMTPPTAKATAAATARTTRRARCRVPPRAGVSDPLGRVIVRRDSRAE